jgi:hypothetical protein
MNKMFKIALIVSAVFLTSSYAFESNTILNTPQGQKVAEHAFQIAPNLIFTRWHEKTDHCQKYTGSCTFQGIPVVHIEIFKDYAVMQLEKEIDNYALPIEELPDLSLAEQHTVCRILEKNGMGHLQEDSCGRIAHKLRH